MTISGNENIDIHSLKVFCKVVENKSFTKAAKALFLSQPTISSHISKLEKSFGSRLLDRLGNEIIPTKAGLILFEYGSKILLIKDEMVQSIGGYLGNISGKLVLGASTIPGEYILPEFFGKFNNAYPKVKVKAKISDSAKIAEIVASGQAEIGFVGAKPAGLVSEYFDNDNLVLIVPSGHRLLKTGQKLKKGVKTVAIDICELKKEPFIAREPGSGTRKAMEIGLEKAGFNLRDLQVVCELGSTGAVKKAVMESIGVSIISDKAIKHEVKLGLLKNVDVKELNIKRDFYLIYNPRRTLSPIAKSFMKFIKGLKP